MINYDQRGVRTRNRRNVLDFIAKKREVSRQDICDELGSSMTTVLGITDFLIEKGFIEVCGQVKIARGRHPHVLKYNPNGAKAMSVDYDGKIVKVAVCNTDGQELKYWEAEASLDFEVFFSRNLPDLYTQVSSVFPDILGIGISMPGDFSPDLDYVTFGPLSLFQNIERFGELFKKFASSLDIPVFCYNDCNAAAYGEYLRRGRNEGDLVFFYAGDGLGSGFMLDGKLRNGAHYSAGEVGYLVFESTFETDSKNPGWFENHLSEEVLSHDFADKDKKEMIQYVAESLALAISNVSNILDVNLVVLDGGKIQAFGSDLWHEVLKGVDLLCLNPIQVEHPQCTHPSLSGAAALVIQQELDKVLMDSK
ncbi:MAG: ROK family protein [Sphaerochaetaceae bacterium]